MEQADGTWMLQVRTALAALEYEVDTRFGKHAYTTPEAFNTLVINHLIDNITLTANEKKTATLHNGQVKLGHETLAVFEVLGMPKKIKSIRISNTAFRDIYNNQGALIILKKDFSKHQFWLNETNKHTVQLKAVKKQYKLLPSGQ